MKKHSIYIALMIAILSIGVEAQISQCSNLFQKSFIDLRRRSIQSEQDYKMIMIEIAALKPELSREQLIKNIDDAMAEGWIELSKLNQISIKNENSSFIVFEVIKKNDETIIFNVEKPKKIISNDSVSQSNEFIIIDSAITNEIDLIKIQELPIQIIEQKVIEQLHLLRTKTGLRLNEQEIQDLANEILNNIATKSDQILNNFNLARKTTNTFETTNDAIVRFIKLHPDINPLLVSEVVESFFKNNQSAKTIINIEFPQIELDVLYSHKKYLVITALDQEGQFIEKQQSINIEVRGEVLE